MITFELASRLAPLFAFLVVVLHQARQKVLAEERRRWDEILRGIIDEDLEKLARMENLRNDD